MAKYTLSAYDNEHLVTEFRESHEIAHQALNEDGTSADDMLWSNHEKELLQYSALNPTVLFCLQIGDSIRKYFINGNKRYDIRDVLIVDKEI